MCLFLSGLSVLSLIFFSQQPELLDFSPHGPNVLVLFLYSHSEDLRHVKDNKVEFSFLFQRLKTSQIHRLARERPNCGLGEACERRLGWGGVEIGS